MIIEKYSFGTGDRFGKQGSAQLEAIQKINAEGFNVVPVWNKSFREHGYVNTQQADVLAEAKAAVAENGWTGNYYIDADHIGMGNVESFLKYSNFFTIDVAHFIGEACSDEDKSAFIDRHSDFLGKLIIPGIEEEFEVTKALLGDIANNYLKAIQEVKSIYDFIVEKKGADNFIAEVSMDECDIAQTPLELFFILAEIHKQGVAVQTIAPKFTGLFPKGVDYVGDLERFTMEFEQDVAVTKFAIDKLNMLPSLKLSVHSGSDKFSIYPAMKKAIEKFDAGIHIKTAGTTWLEEVIGLAQGGSEGLEIAKSIYSQAYARYDELAGPYATVLDLDQSTLPHPNEVEGWSAGKFARTIIHDQSDPEYDRNVRQLIHIGYKIASEMGEKYMKALEANKDIIALNVTNNIYQRHLKLIFS